MVSNVFHHHASPVQMRFSERSPIPSAALAMPAIMPDSARIFGPLLRLLVHQMTRHPSRLHR